MKIKRPQTKIESLFKTEVEYLRERSASLPEILCDSYTYDLAVEHKVKDPERFKAGTPISMTGEPYRCSKCHQIYQREAQCKPTLWGRHQRLGIKGKVQRCKPETKNSAMARRARWLLSQQFDTDHMPEEAQV